MKRQIDQGQLRNRIEPLFQRFRVVKLLGVYAGLIIIIVVIVALMFTSGDIFQGGSILAGLFLLLYGVEIFAINSAIEGTFWDVLIYEYGLKKYYGKGESLIGVFSELEKGDKFRMIASGNYGEYFIRIGEQTVWDRTSIFGLLRFRPTSKTYKIMEIVTKEPYYHVFLDSKSNNRKNKEMMYLTSRLKSNHRLETEGDVNNFFDIYIPKDADIDSLVTLAPDTLMVAREHGITFDLEFIGNSVHVISQKRLRTSEDILGYTGYIFDLISNLGPVLRISRKTSSNNQLKISE